ncbi:MAG TPA: LiaF domain-containing protein [Acidimicrobiia bacterium]|nr:LiaF domain-containing protein [Acidimicrobiia bacterium]
MKRLFRTLFVIAAVSFGTHLLSTELSRRFVGETRPDDDEFRLAGILGGAQVASTATSLRSVGVKVVCGGVALDLSGATLDSAGAHMDVDVALGGVALTVPPTWRVEVDSTLSGGDVATDLPDADTLEPDAPTLTVRVSGRGGGVAISAG